MSRLLVLLFLLPFAELQQPAHVAVAPADLAYVAGAPALLDPEAVTDGPPSMVISCQPLAPNAQELVAECVTAPVSPR